jgi:nitrate/nitrite transporter NarK
VSAVPDRVSRRALLVWSVGVIAYATAVFDRTSLGVVGLQAAQRFGIGPAALAALGVLQLFVYAAMQIPVGMMLDRVGPRRMLLAGGTALAVAQVLFALAGSLPLALLARVLLGAGDALIFVSVLRLVASWFPARSNPLLVQLTGAVGQCGALVSAVPLVLVMGRFGWTPTYLAVALAGLVVTALVAAWVSDRPVAGPAVPAGIPAPRPAPGTRRAQLRQAWAEPGTRRGLWSHFATQFSGLVFGLLWGFPFLTQAQGLSPGAAAGLLTLLTGGGILAGPLLGRVYGRLPYHRSTVVLLVVAVTAAAWAVVLLWPGRAPLWLLVALVLVLAVNGPTSAIGFDFARTFNPSARMGVATGIVNIGGFTASLSAIALIGVGLDLAGRAGLGAGAGYTAGQFRFAFAAQYLLWALGAWQVWRYRLRARRTLAGADPERFAQLRAGVAVAPR